MVGAFLVGFVVAWAIFSGGGGVNSEVMSDKEMEDGEKLASLASAMSGENSITVSDQEASNTVTLDEVVFENDAWVAIHEERDGGPGNVLGAAWFPAGKNIDAKVELLRGTKEGNTYYAMLHEDVGADHKFDTKIDKTILGDDGKPVMVEFMAVAKVNVVQ